MESFAHIGSLTHRVEKSEEERKKQRKRNIVLLIYDYLHQNGYLNAAEHFKREVGFDLDEYGVCDNINLEMMLQDFETYYFLKYQLHVQIARKVDAGMKVKGIGFGKFKQRLASVSHQNSSKQKTRVFPNRTKVDPATSCGDVNLLTQPLGQYSSLELGNEWRVLAESVCREILEERPSVSWDHVIGHDMIKEILKEALVYPLKYPELYSIVKPWRGMLLYGPTGTGKTMLAKAAATECNATFFYLSPAILTSKWRGESEKLVKVLFELACDHAPSIIFLDEVDSLMSRRSAQEHEASRRFKSELLAQIEGFSSNRESVFIMSASNFPWDIDASMLRRMEQRLYVPLPKLEDRITMLMAFLPPKVGNNGMCIKTKLDYDAIGKLTEGYSGADLRLLSKEVKMQCIRNVIKNMESMPLAANESGKNSNIQVSVVETNDVVVALRKVKPISSLAIDRYEEFTSSCGSS